MGTYQVSVIFQSKDFELDENDLINKFKNEKDELSKLKQFEKGIILDGCILIREMLDCLKVLGKYENDDWLGMNFMYGNVVLHTMKWLEMNHLKSFKDNRKYI